MLLLLWVVAAGVVAYRWFNWKSGYAVLFGVTLTIGHAAITILSGSGAVAMIFLLPVTVLTVFFLTGVRFIMREPTDGEC